MKQNSRSWKWQVDNTIRSVEELREYVHINNEEEEGIRLAESEFSWHMPEGNLLD